MFKKLTLAAVAVAAIATPAFACNDKSCTDKHADKMGAMHATMKTQVAKPELVTTTYEVKGIHCADCVKEIQGKVSKLKGVSKVDASVEKGTVTITATKGSIDAAKLNAALAHTEFKLGAVVNAADKAMAKPASMKMDKPMVHKMMAPMKSDAKTAPAKADDKMAPAKADTKAAAPAKK